MYTFLGPLCLFGILILVLLVNSNGCFPRQVEVCGCNMCDRVKTPMISILKGDGHQPNSRVLYTHYKHFLLKVG